MEKKTLLLSAMKPKAEDPKNNGKKPVNNDVRQWWNKFVDYVDSKGMRGKPELDKGGLGFALLDEFVKKNPDSKIRRENLDDVLGEMRAYRSDALEKSKRKEAVINVPEEKFMAFVVENDKTQNPVYPGQNFTKFKFPDFVFTNKTTGEQQKGFATTQTTQQLAALKQP
jgi:hypothetical protein